MSDEHRPLLLLVSDQESRLMAVRSQLRAAGYLVASSRSVGAAVSLLEQVRVDGCVLLCQVSVIEAGRLEETLNRYTPHCPKVHLVQQGSSTLPGWSGCPEELLVPALERVFATP